MDERTSEISQSLISKAGSALEKRPWQDKLMDKLMAVCMADDNLRIQLFRFIDVFPVLKSNSDIVNHFFSYVGPYAGSFPWFIRMPLWFADKPVIKIIAGTAISRFVKLFAKHFIIDSTDQKKVEAVGHNLRKQGYDITWDILGEDVLTQDEAANFKKQYLNLIERLGCLTAPAGFSNNVSIKLSSLVPKFQWDPINFDGCVKAISGLFAEFLGFAKKHGVAVNVDIEQYAVRDLAMAIFKQALEKEEFKDLKDVGVVIQAYLADAESVLDNLLSWINQTKRPVTIRLVKGAYWDYEIMNAKHQRWSIPVLTDKAETDKLYDYLAQKILKAQKSGLAVRLACASHNLNSIAYVMAQMEELGLGKNQNEFQVLYGMGDPIREAVLQAGYPVRVYTPYGELIPSMGYLVRRLLENTSQQSFLGLNFLKQSEKEVKQEMKQEATPASAENKESKLLMPKNYRPTALTDFSKQENREAMQDALLRVHMYVCRKKYPLIIGDKRIETKEVIYSENPSYFSVGHAIGWTSKASVEHAESAMKAAKEAFAGWNETPVEERAKVLLKAAEIASQRRLELAALMVLEASKTWREADADVAEAIDFLRFYGQMAANLMRYNHTEKLPDESNEYGYEGRGVAVVISPWNFPMAIAAGMCSAGLAAGNTVVFKPASATPIIGYKIVEILLEAGVPAGAINFLPGSGGALGEFLVKHPYTTNVIFTGSKKVGFQLIKWAGEADYEQQTHCRRVIAEMGGKNAIVVDATADLDQAVAGVIKSAFGYQGQKCSACSRVIVLDSIYDEFVKRLKGAAAVLKVGSPMSPGTDLGAVIDENAYKEINRHIEIGKKEAALAYQADVSELVKFGWYIGPTIFTDVAPSAVIAQEEIFGPVLAVIKAKSFEKALEIVNSSKYKLTGGVYSRTDEHIALTRKYFKVGNLYINRPITGAVVGTQPFGGFGASGTGPKAGGPDYLLQLMAERAISENLIRRGFSPELKN